MRIRRWRAPPRVHLDVSVAEEACPLNLAPTASTTATLAHRRRAGRGAARSARLHVAGFRALASGRRARPQAAAARRRTSCAPATTCRSSARDAPLAEGLVGHVEEGPRHVRRRRGRPHARRVHRRRPAPRARPRIQRAQDDHARGHDLARQVASRPRSSPPKRRISWRNTASPRCRWSMRRARWWARSTCTTCCAPECCERRERRLPARRCAACGCWCSTWTACSPTAGSSTARRAKLLKAFHVRDGHGIKQVAAAGITVAIISGRKSAAVARARASWAFATSRRARPTSSRALRKLAKARRARSEDCACVGDDTPDAPILRRGGSRRRGGRCARRTRSRSRTWSTTRAGRPRRGPRGLRLADRGAQGVA